MLTKGREKKIRPGTNGEHRPIFLGKVDKEEGCQWGGGEKHHHQQSSKKIRCEIYNQKENPHRRGGSDGYGKRVGGSIFSGSAWGEGKKKKGLIEKAGGGRMLFTQGKQLGE